MEIMESIEIISSSEVKEIGQKNLAEIRQITSQLSKSFQEGDLDEANQLTLQLQYLMRIHSLIENQLGTVIT